MRMLALVGAMLCALPSPAAPFQGRGMGGPPGGGPGMRRGQDHPHIGQWLKKNQNLSPEEQEKKLTSDPEFQKLPPQKQNKLLERLRQFNSLPPDQRKRIVHRMDRFEHLTPEQQEQARQIFDRVRQMPDDRRQQFRQGMRQLVDLPPDKRLAAIDSPDFRGRYNDEERGLMRQVVNLNVLPEHAEAPPPQR